MLLAVTPRQGEESSTGNKKQIICWYRPDLCTRHMILSLRPLVVEKVFFLSHAIEKISCIYLTVAYYTATSGFRTSLV
jgi:hypothetical protein